MKACKEGQLHVIQFLIDHTVQAASKKRNLADFSGMTSSGAGKHRAQGAEKNMSKLAKSMDQAEKKRLLDAKDDEGKNRVCRGIMIGCYFVAR